MPANRITEHVAAGDFKRAAEWLSARPQQTLSDRVLGAQIELEIGDTQSALSRAHGLLSERLEPRLRAICFNIAGRALSRLGAVREGIGYQRKAVVLAGEIDPQLEPEILADLVSALLNWVGIEPALAELPRLRRLALSVGNTRALIDYHISSARIATMRGWLPRATREARIALDLLNQFPNAIQLWKIKQIQSNVAIKACDMPAARAYAAECLSLAEQSGSRLSIGTTLGNLAHIASTTGDFGAGRQILERAMQSLDPASHMRIAAFSTGIEIGLASGDIEFAEDMLSHRAQLEIPASDEGRYYDLWFALNNVKWLVFRGHIDEALMCATDALASIEKLADTDLLDRMTLIAAECHARKGNTALASHLFAQVCGRLQHASLETLAELNRVAAVISAEDDRTTSVQFLARAWRILTEAGLLGIREDVLRTCRFLGVECPSEFALACPVTPLDFLRSSATILFLNDHPRVLAAEMDTLLRGVLLARSSCLEIEEDGITSHAKTYPMATATGDVGERTTAESVVLGTQHGRTYTLKVVTNPSDLAPLDWSAVAQLARSAESTRSRRASDEQQIALWPEETPEQQLGMVVVANNMLEVVNTSRRLAPSKIPVLILGETGTGKELLARALHDTSPRKDKPFIPFNCSACARDLLDAQLFGYRRGAFTGAQEAFPGVIRSAAGGTLFLDEIGETTLDVQPKLLRFLESGEIHPLGEPKPLIVDVRVVAATNANLEQLVSEGRFREDLFYRLNVVRLDVPALRERREEIPQLVQHYLEKCSRESHKTGLRFAEETIEYLMLYKWPGNVRQLANEVRRLVALAEPGAVLMPEHLSPEIAASRKTIPASERDLAPTEFVVRNDQPLAAAVEHVERTLIQNAFKRASGFEEAAQILGLSRKGLYLKRQRLGLANHPDAQEPAPALVR